MWTERLSRRASTVVVVLVVAVAVAGPVAGIVGSDVGGDVDERSPVSGTIADAGGESSDIDSADGRSRRAQRTTDIDSCGVIYTAGRYELQSDLSADGSGPCLHVRASDVTIAGNGHTISGTGDSTGVLVFAGEPGGTPPDGQRVDNVTVRGLRVVGVDTGVQIGTVEAVGTRATLVDIAVEDSRFGVRLVESAGSTVRNVSVTGGQSAMLLTSVRNLSASDVSLRSAETGLYLSDTVERSTFRSFDIGGNGEGVYFSDSSTGNAIVDSEIAENSEYGIRFADSSENTIRDSSIVFNSGPGLVSAPATRESIVGVTIRGNDGPAVRVRESSEPFLFDGVTVGDGIAVAPAAGDGALFRLNVDRDAPAEIATVDAASIPDGLPGDVLGDQALVLGNFSSSARIGFPLDGESTDGVTLFAYRDGSWSDVTGATVAAGNVRGVVSGSAVVVPVRVGETDGETQTDGDSDAGTPTQIASCRVIDEPGRYELAGDIDADSGGTCIDIRSSDVVFDGNGNTVAGAGADGSVGVQVYRGSDSDDRLVNVTVRDLQLTGWEDGVVGGPPVDSPGPRLELADVAVESGGVSLYGVDDSVLRDVTVAEADIGVYVWATTNLTATGLEIADGTGEGLFVTELTADSVFRDLTVTGNDGGGVYFSTDTEGNTVSDATIRGNGEFGVRYSDSRGNLVRSAAIESTDGPGISVDTADDERLVDVAVRGSADGRAVEIENGGSLGFRNVSVEGVASLDTPDGDPVVFERTEDGPIVIRATQPDALAPVPPGEPLSDGAVQIVGSSAAVSVTFAVSPPDGTTPQLYRVTDGEWTAIEDATGTTLTTRISGTEAVAPFPASVTDTGPDDADNDTAGTGPVGDGTTLRVLSTADNEFEYEITIDGTAEPTETDTEAADSDDTVERNGDGTVTIAGSTGSNAGDAFEITGEILDVEVSGVEDGYRFVFGGEDVTETVAPTGETSVDSTADDATEEESSGDAEPSILRVLSTADNEFEYEITVEGTAVPTETDTEAADSDDTVERNDDGTVTIAGSTGSNAGDAFEITGEILDVEISGVESGYAVLLDGAVIVDGESTSGDGE